MTADKEKGAGPEPEKHPEARENTAADVFESPQAAAEFIEMAGVETDALKAAGMPFAEQIASRDGRPVDAGTAAELAGIAAEADAAEAELRKELQAAENEGAEKPPDDKAMSRQITDLDALVGRFIGTDGAFDQGAFERIPDDERQPIVQAFEAVAAAAKTDPAGFLASAEALRGLRVGELREQLLDDAARELAERDPDRAFAEYQKFVETGLLEQKDEKSVEGKRREFDGHFVRSELHRITETADLDPLEGANRLAGLRERASAAGISISFEERQADERVRKAMEQALASGQDGVDMYRRLADTAPGNDTAAWAVARRALEQATGGWDEKKKAAISRLADQAPEALLHHATGQYTSSGWTPEERLQLVEKIIARPDGKRSVLAELKVSDLPPNAGPEVRRALLEAYAANRPERLVDNVEVFASEIAALPERQRNELVDKTIERDPYAIVRQSESWKGVLTEKQIRDMVVSMAGKGELRVGPDSFLLKKMPEVLDAFTPEVVDSVIQRQTEAALELAASGKIPVSPEQNRRMTLQIAKLDRLYDDNLERLQKIGALTPETLDAVVDNAPAVALRLAAEGKAGLSDEQAKRSIARRLEAGRLESFETVILERLVGERGLKMSEAEVWTILDSGLSGGNLADAKVLGAIRRLAESAEAGPRLSKLVNAAERIVSSPSASLRRLSREMLGQLRDAEDPEAAFTEVEGIFERNQLPLTGKVFKVFEVLNPKDRLAKMAGAEHCSPTLRAESHRGRIFTMYKDLLRAHLDSNNPSLRGYLETIQGGQALADKVDAGGLESLSADERGRFDSFVGKLKRLYESSTLGRTRGDEPPAGTETADIYKQVRRSLGVAEGGSLGQRVAEMYLKPIGLDSIESALARMDSVKTAADRRNRELAAGSGGQLAVREGDLLKGFDAAFLRNILENGSVAKEFLGASSDSDATPLDTDVARVDEEDAAAGFAEALKKSPAQGYGEMLMLVRDRGQFQKTSAADLPADLTRHARVREPKLELFQTGVIDPKRHYGIRTGLPSSEIDALIVTDRLAADSRRLDSRVMDVVANGQYIPVADERGRILLTPEDFDSQRRRFFAGLEGQPFRYVESSLERSPEHSAAIEAIIEEKRRERPVIEGMNADLRGAVIGELQARGIETGAGFSELLASAEVYDTGSTSRGTNVPGAVDFDYIVKLNAADMEQVGAVNEALVEKLGGQKHEGHRTEQLRLLGSKLGAGGADVDIGFVSKAEASVYESHDAVRDRLDAIRGELGEKAYEKVVANIVLAKKLLKEGGAYKKFEHGGMGGIGVENWLLSEGGSALTAFESFEKSAFDGDKLRPLEQFRNDYKVMDPGVNAKTGGHDNFVGLLTEDGYRKMAETVRKYLSQVRG